MIITTATLLQTISFLTKGNHNNNYTAYCTSYFYLYTIRLYQEDKRDERKQPDQLHAVNTDKCTQIHETSIYTATKILHCQQWASINFLLTSPHCHQLARFTWEIITVDYILNKGLIIRVDHIHQCHLHYSNWNTCVGLTQPCLWRDMPFYVNPLKVPRFKGILPNASGSQGPSALNK